MATQSLIYSFVARGATILAEYSAYVGNFNQVAAQCLERLPPENKKSTYSRDGFTFNFLTESGFTYCVVAEDSFSRAVAFAFLGRIKDDFTAKFGGGKAESAFERSLDKQYRPKLKEEMEFCEKNPGDVEKVAGLKEQVKEVQSVMLNNIDAVMSRGVKLEDLTDKTDLLRDHAQTFQETGRRIRKKMWYDNLKAKVVVIAIFIVLGIVIWLSVCRGFTCSSGSSSSTPSPPSPSG